jgi:hypothetical protein
MQTRGISADDWFMPEPDTDQGDANVTTAEGFAMSTSNRNARGTDHVAAPSVSAPIRKDDLVIRLADNRIKLLQQWECVISRVKDDCVECEMHDLTNESLPVEFAEVYLDEFNHFDRALLQEGAVFYWSVGHETSKTGQVRRYSELRVRRMPTLSNLRRREILKEAEHLSELLNTK